MPVQCEKVDERMTVAKLVAGPANRKFHTSHLVWWLCRRARTGVFLYLSIPAIVLHKIAKRTDDGVCACKTESKGIKD